MCINRKYTGKTFVCTGHILQTALGMLTSALSTMILMSPKLSSSESKTMSRNKLNKDRQINEINFGGDILVPKWHDHNL